MPVIVAEDFGSVWKPVLGSLFALVFVVVVFLALLYRFRDTVQVFLYDYFGWWKRRHLVDQDDKLFDVFIAYSNTNSDYVIDRLLPHLEDHHYRTCIHQRDFKIGCSILDSIANAISNSKRVIIVLSQDFIASDWCMFEFQQAVCQVNVL